MDAARTLHPYPQGIATFVGTSGTYPANGLWRLAGQALMQYVPAHGKTIMMSLLLYITSVVLVNFAFDVVPLIRLPGGEFWPPVSLVVGFVFVIRDFAQRETGHWVLAGMLAGGVLSWVMATPAIALASVCAFFTSEMTDWAVYTFTGRPFSQRILLSSLLSTPVDSVVFLVMTGLFSIPALVIMTLSKLAGALVVYVLVRRRESAAPCPVRSRP